MVFLFDKLFSANFGKYQPILVSEFSKKVLRLFNSINFNVKIATIKKNYFLKSIFIYRIIILSL